MPVPKRHTTRSKKRMRSSLKRKRAVNLSVCPNCQAPKLPHRICHECGYYGDKQILQIEES